MNNNLKTVLFVVAHPDDEVLGCGGTIARLTSQGIDVSVAILGEGVASRHDKHSAVDVKEIELLEVQSRASVQSLGVRDVSYFRLPDNRFDTLPLLEIVKLIENLIATRKPTVVYTHHAGDLNIDHVLTNRAVLTATRPEPGMCVREVLSFEVPSSTEWAFGIQPTFEPNVFVDISETLSAKLKAMGMYEGESRIYPHPRSPEALTSIAAHRGSMVGVNYAEAFVLLRAFFAEENPPS